MWTFHSPRTQTLISSHSFSQRRCFNRVEYILFWNLISLKLCWNIFALIGMLNIKHLHDFFSVCLMRWKWVRIDTSLNRHAKSSTRLSYPTARFTRRASLALCASAQSTSPEQRFGLSPHLVLPFCCYGLPMFVRLVSDIQSVSAS